MTSKSAAFLAMIGMLLLTILLAADFIHTVLGVVRDVVPADGTAEIDSLPVRKPDFGGVAVRHAQKSHLMELRGGNNKSDIGQPSDSIHGLCSGSNS